MYSVLIRAVKTEIPAKSSFEQDVTRALDRAWRILFAAAAVCGVSAALLWLAAVHPPAVRAQTAGQPTSSPAGQTANSDELTTHDSSSVFKVKTHVVIVRVVVRDANGQIVTGLKKDDFKLFDNRKPQMITNFSVATPFAQPSIQAETAEPGEPREEAGASAESPASTTGPLRYLALYFDDVHLNLEDLMRSRNAAERQLTAALPRGDRVGIFTSSGVGGLDFTDDHDKLHETLLRLIPRPVAPIDEQACPSIDYYQANQIVNQNDPVAFQVATQETLECRFDDDPRYLTQAAAEASTAALQALRFGETQTYYALRELEKLAGRLSHFPGRRNIVLISPGFLAPTQQYDLDLLIERALRSNIVINAVDARGLWAPDVSADQDNRLQQAAAHGKKELYRIHGEELNADVLAQLADATGGIFFHNNNDLDLGFRNVAAVPGMYYVLGFVPQDLKLDGRFHSIKVTLANSSRWTIQARRGYFAPKKAENAADAAKQEIEEAIFSQDEMNELPVALHTRFFKPSNTDAVLSVLAHVDLRGLRFRKAEGRNCDDLTVVTALFDRNGNLLDGKQKFVEMRLRDETLDRLTKSGITMKTNFDVKPGTYLVRLVVRDTEGAQISAQVRTVEIP